MFLRSLSFKIPRRGLWSVTIISSLHPKINMCTLLRLQEIAKHSPSVGAYQLSASVVNRDPANTRCQPSGQHVGALVGGQEQCCCRSR